ncbi:MAG: dihydroorotase [Elusimicrobia bacterium]|nr:dihydroorotase [Elusimicrobiota bacterium]
MEQKALWIVGAEAVDPEKGLRFPADLYVGEGKILGIFSGGLRSAASEIGPEAERLDGQGLILSPGLVDAHVHLRDPGQTHQETIETGTRAAIAGGVTSLLCMANTTPVLDNPSVLRQVIERARREGSCRTYPVAAVTERLEGRRLAPLELLAEAGAVAFSDDGKAVGDLVLMKEALQRAKALGKRIISHCEDSTQPARSRSAEWKMVERDLDLALQTGGLLHLAHLSLRESVRLVRQAKREGAPVSAEVCPHHLVLTQEDEGRYGTLAKMYPPLRSPEDREALREALSDGTVDVIASDHAPHAAQEKISSFLDAPNGIIGLETLFSLSFSALVESNVLSLPELLGKLSFHPARIFGLPAGRLEVGGPADLVLWNLRVRRKVEKFFSKSSNSPFLGWELPGAVDTVGVGGRIVFRGGRFLGH